MKNSLIDLLIYDFDGTLTDAPWNGLFEAYKEMIEKVCHKDWRQFFRNLEEFKIWHDPDWLYNHHRIGLLPEMKKAAQKIFYDTYDPYMTVYPALPEILRKLKNRYQMTILTNRSGRSAQGILGDLADHFPIIIGEEDLGVKLKPDPEGIWMILKRLRIEPQKALMIGDVKNDILAGKSAGTKTGFVTWGYGNLQDAKPLNPDFIFTEFEELQAKLLDD